jgi:hypothetical protein
VTGAVAFGHACTTPDTRDLFSHVST